ncbi:MAG: 3-dehydroquinate synthase [Candidatus Acidiferrales bacterium]
MRKRDRGGATTLWVRTPTARYPVWLGDGLLADCGRRLRRLRPRDDRVFVVSSPRVWKLWGRPLERSLRRARLRCETLLMDDRETAKRLATVERLADELLRRGADRSALLAALGGGVVGDVTGFLAASFMRGVDFVQIPTTLVAQVDSAIGGKTGVNLRSGKNLVGAFHHPRAVLADPRALGTLPDRDFRAGLYEVVKCAVIGDARLFQFLERKLPAVLSRQARPLAFAIESAVRLKAAIVAADEREAGLRRLLNFGHTFAHAFEVAAGFRLRHGEAVGWGMLAATRLAERRGFLRRDDAERVARLVRAVGKLPPLPRVPPARLYAHLLADKKKRGRELRFVLPRGIGRAQVIGGIPRAAILAVLRELSAG